jgi:hypothetical protein
LHKACSKQLHLTEHQHLHIIHSSFSSKPPVLPFISQHYQHSNAAAAFAASVTTTSTSSLLLPLLLLLLPA